MNRAIYKLCFGLLFIFSLSQASNFDNTAQINSRTPLLKPSEAVELAKAYLKKEIHVDLRKYKLAHISFTFYSEYESKKKYNGEWHIAFEKIGPRPPDSGLHIEISNDQTPQLRYIQIP